MISKPGKHGSSKKAVITIDIITDIFKASSIIMVPDVKREDYIIMNIDEYQMELLTRDGRCQKCILWTHT
ncbi:Hypothetical protein HVR_LOCUS1375 [uncultured virus]|nr:Hypothetical protein HVR_LOCUS1375 [uncultured virus]